MFTICHVDAGHTYNVFPDSARLLGTLRVFNDSVKEITMRRIREIAEQTAQAHGCTAEVNYIDKYPVVWNHEKPALKV